MGYWTADRGGSASSSLPALVPSLSLPVALVRTTVSAGLDMAGRTLRACTTVDPAAVVTALAALPALAEGVAQLVQRLAVVAERVEGVLDGVENTQGRVDGLVDDLSGLPARIDAISTSADAAIARVSDVTGSAAGAIEQIDSIAGTASGAIGRIDGITGTAAGAIDKIDAITATAAGAIEKVGSTTDAAGEAIGKVDGLVEHGNRLISDTGGVIESGRRTVDQANETIRAADPSVRQLAEITDTVARLRPLLENLEDVDPELSRELVSMLRSLPGLMQRVDERVVPAVSSLEGLVPVVRTLHENVNQLQHVVNDVGTLLSGLPGAGRLLKRGGREVRSADNKTAITPPE